MATPERRGSFWTTLPGVLTGVAAIVTAVGTLVAALVAAGIIRPPGTEAGRLQVTASVQGFGTVQVGQGSPASVVTISNLGKGAATVTAELGGSNPGDFKITDNACAGASLGASTTCQLQLAFSPRSQGDKVATLGFGAGNAPNPPGLRFTGTGRGVALVTFEPATVSIRLSSIRGTPPTSGTKTLTITNTGTGDLTINSVRSDDLGGHFSVSPGCDSRVLAPNQACQVTVRFTATTFGQFSARLQVFDSLSPGLHLVPVSGYRGLLIVPIVPGPSS